ncbi:MAG: hypothetical protein JKY31_13310, partial [Rhodobacteraceae bacterium]|nr:hypothetical protein [Paracoccaceae bacterium]
MYYRHLAQHQYILQHALREATGVDIVPGDPNEKPKSYTDQEFIDYLGLTETTPKKLSAFRKFHIQDNITSKFSFTPPNEIRSPLGHRADCEKIWNYLSKREFIRSAMERMQGDVDKKVMYHEREYGSTMSCFYNAHTSQIAKHAAEGLANIVSYGDEGKGKEWFLYKRSFKREGCLIKS